VSLVPCRECGHKISSGAWRCPSCGGWTLQRPARWLEAIGVFFFLAVMAVPIYGQASLEDWWAFAIFGALPGLIIFSLAQRRPRG
jgi:hypothetical protein